MNYPEGNMDQNIESQKPPLQMEKEEYLAKLPSFDQVNVRRITELFGELLREEARGGYLLAVGGTLTKPLPRPDIDLVAILQDKPSDPKQDDYEDGGDFTAANFKILENLVNRLVKKNPSFQISQIKEPRKKMWVGNVQKVFQYGHDGSIIVTNREGGAPIEFMRRTPKDSYKEFASQERWPYVLLASVEPVAKEIVTESKQFIPLPNLQNPQDFQHWLETYIQTPIRGFEELTHPDGRPYIKEEQLEATRKQITDVVNFKHSKKEPLENILKMLMNYAYESSNTSRT